METSTLSPPKAHAQVDIDVTGKLLFKNNGDSLYTATDIDVTDGECRSVVADENNLVILKVNCSDWTTPLDSPSSVSVSKPVSFLLDKVTVTLSPKSLDQSYASFEGKFYVLNKRLSPYVCPTVGSSVRIV